MRNREGGFIGIEEGDKDDKTDIPPKTISRRKFLKLGAVGLTAAILSPEKLLSQDRQSKSSRKELKENYNEKLGSLLRWNVEIEQPNAYQLKQIIEMKGRIVNKIKDKKFSSTVEMLKFINLEIDANFEDKKATVYLKDAFAEQEGAQPKGNFDCDARAVMCQAVLEELGFTSADVEMCAFEGHMMLLDKATNQYFETTKNQVVTLSESERVQQHVIDSYEKYLSYLISNEATQLAQQASGEIFGSKHMDKDKLSLAIDKFSKALKLDKDNITASLNFIKLVKDKLLIAEGDDKTQLIERASAVYKNMLIRLVKRYYNIADNQIESGGLKLKDKEERPTLPEKKKVESLKDLGKPVDGLIQGAIVGNNYIQDKFNDYASFNYFTADNYEEAIKTWQLLLTANEKSDGNMIDRAGYKIYMAKAHFKNQDYKKFIKIANDAMSNLYELVYNSNNSAYINYRDNLREEMDVLSSQILAAKIMLGEIEVNSNNVEDFCHKYKNDNLLGPFISGERHWSLKDIDAVEALKGWPGFSKLIKLIKKTKVHQAAVKELKEWRRGF